MKTLKDKTQYWYDDEAVEDLKQAIKDLKDSFGNNHSPLFNGALKFCYEELDKIMGVWEE